MNGHGARRRTIAAVVAVGAAIAGSAGLALADPPADFSVAPGRPVPGEAVTFTAQAECAAPVACTWAFGDGGSATGKQVEHTFAGPGRRTVTLTVDDPDDPAEASVLSGEVRVDAPPAADFSFSPGTPNKDDTVTFDGRASSDPDGDALTYRWDFDGNGTIDGEGAEITHAYASAGSFQATLTVDDGRLSHTVFKSVVVRSAPPAVHVTPSVASPLTAQDVVFTAAASDPDGTVVAYAWDLDADGAFDDGNGTPSAAAGFALPGSRTVRVRVTDDDGETAEAETTVTVLNREPVPAFTVAPDPVPQEQPVTLTSRATDPEGRLAGEAWDLDGDGAYDDAAGPTATLTFTSAAPRTVGLRVTDQDGGASELRREIVPGNETPRAAIAVTPESPLSAEDVTFNAAAEDADGSIVAYEWDVDGDGAFDDGSAASITTAYAIPGSRTVRLRVTDDDGGAATAQKRFAVVNRPPKALFIVPVVFKNEPAVFTSTSVDPEGRLASVSWDLDGDGFFDDGAGTSVQRVFSSVAKVTVSLRAEDADGGQDTFASDVIPGNRSPSAGFTASDDSVLTGETIRFTSTATDEDGGIAQLEWDVGSGFVPGAAVLETAFAVPGRHAVRLRATDTDGASTTSEGSVFVANRPPVAHFTYSPALVVKGRPVTFASESADPEDRMEQLAWDLDGDGAYDDATGGTASRAYTASGAVSVGLRARDRDGGEDEFRLSLVPGNKAPSAAFTVSTEAGGLAASFTAAAADDDGSVARIEWDLDDDGAFDDASGPTAFWSFPAPGTHRVSLRVTDDDGSSSVAVKRVTIAARAGAAGGGGAGGGAGTVATPTAPGGAQRPRAARLRLLAPWPVVRMAGSLTRRGARLTLLSVRAPRTARIAATCRGKGCPRRSVARRGGRRAVRLGAFERRLRAGTVLEIRVGSATRIGKYTRIRIRRGKAPARLDRCLWPGRTVPRRCPG